MSRKRRYPPGFEDGHKPLKEIAKRKKNGQVATEFPSRKYVSEGSIRTTSILVSDMLKHLEADPDVIRISSFPMEVEYEIHDRYGPIGVETHIPEIGALYRDWSVSYLDARKVADLERFPKLLEEAEAVNDVLVKSHGATFAIKNEHDIYMQPRWWNIGQVFRHPFHNKMIIDKVAVVVKTIGLPTSWGHVFDAAIDAIEPGYPNSDEVYYALVALHRRGDIDLSLDRPFDRDTVISKVPGFDHEAE